MTTIEPKQGAAAHDPTNTTSTSLIPEDLLELPDISKLENKPKRRAFPFVQHKKTLYLARRGKPNPTNKKDGTPGDPIPFGSWYVYQTVDGEDYRFSLKTEVYEEAKAKHANWIKSLKVVPTTYGTLSSLLPEVFARRKTTRKGKRGIEAVVDSANRLVRCCPFMTAKFADLENVTILTEWATFVESGRQVNLEGKIVQRCYKANTLNNDCGLLRCLIKLATKKHLIPEDHELLLDLEAPDLDHTCPKRVTELTQATFEQIRWHMYNGPAQRHPHAPIIFDVYWMSGGRKSSVSHICTEDVNFTTGRLFFRVAKGRPEGYSVPMSLELKSLLKEHITTCNKEPGDDIFDIVDINGSIATACEKAGWHRMHAHDFRHKFACNALERTKNISLVAKWLGHKDGGILAAKVYATTIDEDSERHMREDMVFIFQKWSVEGLSLMKWKLQQKLTNIAQQAGSGCSQEEVEKCLFDLKTVIEDPLSAVGVDPNLVLVKESVIPMTAYRSLFRQMVDWIAENPGIPNLFIVDILKTKFPDSTKAIRRLVMLHTRIIRKNGNRAANADLHSRMVDYLRTHPKRYIASLLYDFPASNVCSANRAILSVYHTIKNMNSSRDTYSPLTFKELRMKRKEKQLAALKGKLFGTALVS